MSALLDRIRKFGIRGAWHMAAVRVTLEKAGYEKVRDTWAESLDTDARIALRQLTRATPIQEAELVRYIAAGFLGGGVRRRSLAICAALAIVDRAREMEVEAASRRLLGVAEGDGSGSDSSAVPSVPLDPS